MATLQRPAYVWLKDRLVAWDDANVHVASEAILRGVNVFEGVKGYWSADGKAFNGLALREHHARLCQSASRLYMPFSMPPGEFVAAATALVAKILVPGKDLWFRPTVLAVEGHWGEGTRCELVITAYTQEMQRPRPIALGVSTWRRADDATLPARIKTPANYQSGRLARIEGRRQGFDDMVLLNAAGRVAEASAACVLLVRDGVVATPPCSENCLDSITVRIVERICRELDVPFVRRPIDRSELYQADELCIAGTLAELVPVAQFDGTTLPAERPVFDRIADRFWDIVRDVRPLAGVELSRLG